MRAAADGLRYISETFRMYVLAKKVRKVASATFDCRAAVVTGL